MSSKTLTPAPPETMLGQQFLQIVKDEQIYHPFCYNNTILIAGLK
jgi:hypothetical protein